jgi:hypothetical protein
LQPDINRIILSTDAGLLNEPLPKLNE